MAEIDWFPFQINNLFCRLQIVRTVKRSITKTIKLKNFREKFPVFKDKKTEKGENVFIDEEALTLCLKVYFKS